MFLAMVLLVMIREMQYKYHFVGFLFVHTYLQRTHLPQYIPCLSSLASLREHGPATLLFILKSTTTIPSKSSFFILQSLSFTAVRAWIIQEMNGFVSIRIQNHTVD